jgi:HAD superfamily hydrolase (TIGR01509 family)
LTQLSVDRARPFRPRAVVFDMDGLLLDTERLAMDTFFASCRQHGFEPETAVYVKCIGTRGDRTREILTEGYGADFPCDAVMAEWAARYDAHVLHRPVAEKKGARALLECLEARGVPLALATSTRTDVALRKLALARLDTFFRHVVGGDQVRHPKPDPEPYLTAAQRLGVSVRDCWALEDSENGVRSAHAAGMWVVQVPDLLAPTTELRALEHRIVASLEEVRELIEST